MRIETRKGKTPKCTVPVPFDQSLFVLLCWFKIKCKVWVVMVVVD